MNKKIITTIAPFVILAAIIFYGTSVSAGVFNAPAGSPPANNTNALITVGTTDQVKIGGLGVEAFLANQNAAFNKQLFLGSIIVGKDGLTENPSTLSFGGTDGTGTNRKVAVEVNGDLTITSGTYSDTLKHGSGNGGTYKELCADASGTLILCPLDLSSIIPYFVAVSEIQTKAPSEIECDDGQGGSNGRTTRTGQEIVDVKLEFYESKAAFNASRSNFWCQLFPNSCMYDMTGKGLKIRYTSNGTAIQSGNMTGTSAILITNVTKGFYNHDTYNCTSDFTVMDTYSVQDSLSDPVPYTTQ